MGGVAGVPRHVLVMRGLDLGTPPEDSVVVPCQCAVTRHSTYYDAYIRIVRQTRSGAVIVGLTAEWPNNMRVW